MKDFSTLLAEYGAACRHHALELMASRATYAEEREFRARAAANVDAAEHAIKEHVKALVRDAKAAGPDGDWDIGIPS